MARRRRDDSGIEAALKLAALIGFLIFLWGPSLARALVGQVFALSASFWISAALVAAVLGVILCGDRQARRAVVPGESSHRCSAPSSAAPLPGRAIPVFRESVE